MANSKVSNLRIVLLGKSVSENSGAGNFLLGRAAFDSEAPPDLVERVGGRLKDRHVTIINSAQLLQTNISDHQITQTVRECVSLSDPGPHAFILVLQYKDFTEEDMRRVKRVLEEFSEEAIKRTIVLTTDEETPRAKGASVKANEFIQQLTEECGGGLIQHKNDTQFCSSEIFKRIQTIWKQQRVGSSVNREDSGSVDSDLKEKREEQSGVSVNRKQKLNLVLCGSDETLKNSVSKLIREKKDVELYGRVIRLVELPAVNQLSEEEVMRETLRCVSLCDPGVHVFLLIIPDDPLNNEDKAEMEEIQRIFSSRIKNHLMVVIMQENSSATEAKTSLQTFEGHRFVLENSSQVPALLQEVENIVQENKESFYTSFMYLQARVELEKNKHRAEIEELRKSQSTAGLTHSDDDDDGVRIVMMGKTGVGKSATGNTILRKTAFNSKLTSRSVTRECQKETAEFNSRRISVIDTPGLFDTGVDNIEIIKEIVKCISMAAPGPHVFLLVIQLGRFTQEEKDAVKMIQESFGDKSREYTMVLFTRGDDLGGEERVEAFIEDDDSLKNLIQQCGQRYHVFNNKTEDQTQVSELLEMIDRMVEKNGGTFYTNEMFQQVEKNIKEEQERILKEKEEEIKRKEEELKTKYEAEIEEMKKEKERERQEMHNEQRKREEEFKKKEEEIKKEMDDKKKLELQKKLEKQKKEIEDENKIKEKALKEQQNKLINSLEEKHDKEKQKLQEETKRETREEAEREVAKNAEAKLSYRAKFGRDWGHYVPVAGGAAGGVVGGVADVAVGVKNLWKRIFK